MQQFVAITTTKQFAVTGQLLLVEREAGNPHDLHSVCVKKDSTRKDDTSWQAVAEGWNILTDTRTYTHTLRDTHKAKLIFTNSVYMDGPPDERWCILTGCCRRMKHPDRHKGPNTLTHVFNISYVLVLTAGSWTDTYTGFPSIKLENRLSHAQRQLTWRLLKSKSSASPIIPLKMWVSYYACAITSSSSSSSSSSYQ